MNRHAHRLMHIHAHRRFFAALGLLLGLFALAPAANAASTSASTSAPKPAAKAAAKHRVVFQVNEDDSRKWNTVLANINNVQEELGRVEITVVAIGPGLGMLKADALTANGVQDAMAAGVRFVACGNTMKSLHLTKDDMIDGIDYARAGYVEIMRLQKLGHAYLRP
ncbi:MAG: DsrE family protein [Sulfuritalea sp.]|nr:DsrE family protein [Sulfuritalea sp.]